MNESGIQKGIIEDAAHAGMPAIRINSGQIKKGRSVIHLAPAGTPDLLIPLHGGRCLWIETKTAVGKLSDDQQRVHAELRDRGHVVLVARSRDDFLGWLMSDQYQPGERSTRPAAGGHPSGPADSRAI